MMLTLKDVREYISALGIAADENVYIGKMDNKKAKSIGVYARAQGGEPFVAAGGVECTTYGTKRISLLIHWTKSKNETEQAAAELFERLSCVQSAVMGETQVYYIRMMVPEPQDVGTDDGGTCEYVIWIDIIHGKGKGN